MGFTASDHKVAAEVIESLIPRFRAAELADWLERSGYQPRFNIGPGQDHLIVRARSGRPILTRANWGLHGPQGRMLINARAETVAERPSFRAAFARGRGLAVADGFYEWDHHGARRQPHWISPVARRGLLFATVGLREGDERDHFAVVTVPANAEVAELHPRMPAIIDPTHYERWLFGSEAEAQELLISAPAGSLKEIPVSRRVNSLEHDDPTCVEPVEIDAEPSQLGLLPD